MKKIWELFPELVKAIQKSHDEVDGLGYGHDFDHALRVGNLAYRLSIEKGSLISSTAGVAGLCHNADRIIQVRDGLGVYGKVDHQKIRSLIVAWLKAGKIDNSSAINWVIELCLKHSEPNKSDDDSALIALKDADRVVNMEPDVIMRNGQFCLPNFPVVDPINLFSDPTASFRNCKSVLRALQNALDWVDPSCRACIRLPEARKLAESRAQFLRIYIDKVIQFRRDMGLLDGDYPVFDKV